MFAEEGAADAGARVEAIVVGRDELLEALLQLFIINAVFDDAVEDIHHLGREIRDLFGGVIDVPKP